MPQPLELLAPAKNLECGIAAIDHGADAVYIGAPILGARAAVGNSVDDIRCLCDYAHRFLARVYVTVNTLVYDQELAAARALLEDLCEAGADALLVQDMALLEIAKEVVARQGVGVEIHASTQTDNRTAERVEWLHDMGCSRVVLARELSVDDIRTIHERVPNVQLEAFVHGALCVSYSGVCYASQHCFGRSANRGECAQFCRLKFQLVDADGRSVGAPRHWLSLRDMSRIDYLDAMAEAGVSSFKVEGRLKDIAYVKNVVAAYSQRLDQVVAASGGKFCRASLGKTKLSFTPHLKKTFNRGFTGYFITKSETDIASPDTPKALGEYVGRVKELRRDSFNVAGTASFSNGDGLCFFDSAHELKGFRVNRVEGNRIFPQKMPSQLKPGMGLYRNSDAAMDKVLLHKSAERRIPVDMRLSVNGNRLLLEAEVTGGELRVKVDMEVACEVALQPQAANMERQLSRLGNTPYEAAHVTIDNAASRLFVPSSLLAELRRRMVSQLDGGVERLVLSRRTCLPVDSRQKPSGVPHPLLYDNYSYLYNIANKEARRFYERQGLPAAGDAFELGNTLSDDRKSPALLMQCRHCIRRLLGACTRDRGEKPHWREPLSLLLPDGRRFRLRFDCQQCQMLVYAE